MISFRYLDDDCENLLIVNAEIGDWVAGSVVIKEHSSRQVSLGQLYVKPEWRCQHVARRIMEHALSMFPRAEKWLYAEPYVPDGGKPGPPREILESFYASLGFEMTEDAGGRVAMVKRLTHEDTSR